MTKLSKENLSGEKQSGQRLQGWRIVILRPQNDLSLEELIQSYGGVAESLPMISIVPLAISPEETSTWQSVLKQASYLFIASQNAVHCAPAALLKTMAQSNDLKIITMGKATSIAVTNVGLSVFYTPPPGTTSETLLKEPFLQENALQDKTVALLAGEGGRNLLADTVAQRGAKVQWCRVYRQEQRHIALAPFIKKWQQTNKNCFIATSLNMLESLLRETPENEKAWILQQSYIVISDRIAQYAKECGIQHVYIAKGADLASIAQALQELYEVCDTK